MPASIYPIKHIANGLLRGRNDGEVVNGDDKGKKCLWIGPNIHRLFVALIVIISIPASWRLLVRIAPQGTFYIFSHPLTASLLRTGLPFNILIGGGVLLGGLGFYLLASFLCRDRIPAAAATLFYFFMLSVGAGSSLAGRVYAGGGEVILSLGFIIFSAYFYLLFVNHDGKRNFALALILFALGGLASGMGVFFGLCFYVFLGISEIFLGGGRVKLGRIILAMIGSCLLISFWYHPGFVLEQLRMWGEMGVVRSMLDLIPIFLVSVPVLGTITFLRFDRRDESQGFFVAITTLLVCLFLYIFGKTFDKFFIPNPYRLALIAAVPFGLLFGVIFAQLLRFFDLFKDYMRVKLPLSTSAIFGGLVFLILIALNIPEKGSLAVVEITEERWFWLSSGRMDSGFFAGVIISLLTVVMLVLLMLRSWPRDSYLDRVFSPRGAYEE